MNARCARGLPDETAMAGLAARVGLTEQAAHSGGTSGSSPSHCSPIVRAARTRAPWLSASLVHAWRTLLTAVLLVSCGSVYANDAQLILVAGDVTLQRAIAGQPTQTLVPTTGIRVQRGDALMTGVTGRVQIRFSDGSLVSLQPRSEFRIDDYRFDLDQQRGFFSLVQGALRTISGAVGKREPDDYRMTTPTATIGIRGTEFLVEETVCTPACHPGRTAGLRVSVSAGQVVVFNAAGSIEVPAGSATYVAGPANAPVPTSERPTMSTAPASFDPTNPANTVRLAGFMPGSADGVPPALLDQWTDQSGPTARGPAAGEPQVLVLATAPAAGAPSRLAPPNASRTALPGSPGARQEPSGAATDLPSLPSQNTPSPGTSPTGTLPASPTTGSAPAATPPPAVASNQPIVAAPTSPVPSAANRHGDDEPDADDLLDDIAQAPPANTLPLVPPIDFNRPTATPGAPANPAHDDPGQGPPGSDLITAIVLSPSGDGTMTAPVNGATGTNAQIDPAGVPIAIGSSGVCPGSSLCNPATGGRDGTSGSNGGGASTGGSGTGSGNTGGGDPGNGSPGSGDPGSGDPGSGDPGNGDPGGGTPVLTPGLNSADRVAVRTLQSPWFDLNLTASNAHVRLDNLYRLESIGLCPTVLCISRGTTQVVEAGYNTDVSWGRWVNGNARITVLGFQGNRGVGSNNGVHYLVGVPTVTLPTSGSAYYAIAGATSPTFASGAVAPGVFTGQGLVQFAAGQDTKIGFKGDMVFGSGERYHLFSNGARMDDAGRLVEIGNTQLRMTGRTTFSGSIGVASQGSADRLGCGGGNCQANLEGGFYGPAAARMGVGYSVGRTQGGGDTINGVAVLNRE